MIVFILGNVFALLWLTLSLLHFARRGPLLNNAYLYASKKQRESMNKTPYYRQSAVVFLLLTVAFELLALYGLFYVSLLLLALALVLAAAVAYAIASTVVLEKRKK